MAQTTTARGYGWPHQRLRAQLLAAYLPTDLCWRCQLPLGSDPRILDLGHVDGDKTRHMGLEHRECNRSTNRGRANGSSTVDNINPRPAPAPVCARSRAEINDAPDPLPCLGCGRIASRCW